MITCFPEECFERVMLGVSVASVGFTLDVLRRFAHVLARSQVSAESINQTAKEYQLPKWAKELEAAILEMSGIEGLMGLDQ